jgi:hypothetical protein
MEAVGVTAPLNVPAVSVVLESAPKATETPGKACPPLVAVRWPVTVASVGVGVGTGVGAVGELPEQAEPSAATRISHRIHLE